MPSLGQNLLPVLQLTRMALVFTAIADSLCALILWARFTNDISVLSPLRISGVILVSVGMYGFGMSLNDIIDRRRDKHLAAHRPLPSGRISLLGAYATTLLLAIVAIAGAVVLHITSNSAAMGWTSILLFVFTAALIVFYDMVGKYLGAVGLLTLGFIRFFHALIPAPQWPLVWQPLLLLNHVTILSAVVYRWEQKRPTLTKLHWRAVFGALALVDLLTLTLAAWLRHPPSASLGDTLWVTQGLLLPLSAALIFIAIAYSIYWWSDSPRQAGQNVMLYGLLWLIIYDAGFIAGYVDWVWSLAILALLPISFLSVKAMRWWGRVIALSQKPTFKRVEVH